MVKLQAASKCAYLRHANTDGCKCVFVTHVTRDVRLVPSRSAAADAPSRPRDGRPGPTFTRPPLARGPEQRHSPTSITSNVDSLDRARVVVTCQNQNALFSMLCAFIAIPAYRARLGGLSHLQFPFRPSGVQVGRLSPASGEMKVGVPTNVQLRTPQTDGSRVPCEFTRKWSERRRRSFRPGNFPLASQSINTDNTKYDLVFVNISSFLVQK